MHPSIHIEYSTPYLIPPRPKHTGSMGGSGFRVYVYKGFQGFLRRGNSTLKQQAPCPLVECVIMPRASNFFCCTMSFGRMCSTPRVSRVPCGRLCAASPWALFAPHSCQKKKSRLCAREAGRGRARARGRASERASERAREREGGREGGREGERT